MENIHQGNLSINIKEAVGTITFGHPAGNSLPGALLRKMAQSFLQLGQDSQVKVIILKSEGDRAFCGGASFDELLSIEDESSARYFFSGFAEVINAIRTCGKIVIGRIQVKAVGGGVGLAAAVDYCLASENAAIKLSELAVGIGPFVVGPAVQRKIGLSAFSQMTLKPQEWFPAGWALEKGLFMEVYEEIEQLDIAVDNLARQLASYNPDALAQLKKIFWEGTEHWDKLLAERAGISGQLILSDYSRNFLKQFKEK